MKRYLAFYFLFICSIIPVFADVASLFKKLNSEKKYDQILAYKPEKSDTISSKALYYIGIAYYMKSQDVDAMKYLDSAITKGPADHDMYYYKGMLLFYAKKYNESVFYFDKAITLMPDEPEFFASKGEAYYSTGNIDSALINFNLASKLTNCKARVFLLMGEIYQSTNSLDSSLRAYQLALERLNPSDESYQNCSFNIGLSQQLLGKFPEAKETFEQHIKRYPDDYHTIAKLTQVYYALLEYEKANTLKKKLYNAHKERALPESMKSMFCFDQFMWDGRRVMAFECFDEPDERVYAKHHYYVMDDKGKVSFRIDLESSPAIQMARSNIKYVLCAVIGGSYFTYWKYTFNDNYSYPALKSAVLDILNEKVKPDASFSPGKPDK